LFVNGRRALATRIYPTRHDATGVSLVADADGGERTDSGPGEQVDAGSTAEPNDGPTGVDVDLSMWRMEGAWPAVGGGDRGVDPR
jgi:beta-fructofuranosidase